MPHQLAVILIEVLLNSFILVNLLFQEHVFSHHPDLSVLSIFAEVTVNAAKDPTTFHVINNAVASKYLLA
jgi:hypothetical protein